MHVPIKVDYGVRALVDLAQHANEGPVRAAEIARRQRIPEPFLERLLLTLSKEGLVRSLRGPQGGHVLGLDPEEITLARVMTVLGGAETMVGCLEDTDACLHVSACGQREIWKDLDEVIQRILDSTTIAHILQRTKGVPVPA